MSRRRRARTTDSSAVASADTLPPPAPQVLAVTVLQHRMGPGDVRYSLATYDVTGMTPLEATRPNLRDVAVGAGEDFIVAAKFEAAE